MSRELPVELPVTVPATVPLPAERPSPGAAERLAGIDLARALAMAGMLVAHYVGRDPGGGPTNSIRAFVDGRAMPLFVVLGGVGVSLLTARSPQPDRQLLARALVLLPLGLLLQEWTVGIAVILQYYALFFLAAIPLRRVRDRWLLVGAGVAVALGAVSYQLGAPHPAYDGWLGWRTVAHPAPLLWALFVNGYYPFLPTMAFLLVGMWLGRQRLGRVSWGRGLVVVGLLMALVGYGGGRLLGDAAGTDGVRTDPTTGRRELTEDLERRLARQAGWTVAALRLEVDHRAPPDAVDRDLYLQRLVAQADRSSASFRPARLLDASGHSQMPAWMVGSTGVALAVLGGSLLLCRRVGRRAWPLVAAGQLALTFYVVQAVVIRWTPAVDTTSSGQELLLCGVLFGAFTAAAVLWRSRFRRGPLEAALRAVGALGARRGDYRHSGTGRGRAPATEGGS